MSHTITPPNNTRITLTRKPEYRDGYANSVQMRLSVWDFHLVFGTLLQQAPDHVEIENFQGIYLSPQQAKALHSILGQNLAQYEATFGTIEIEAGQAGTPRYTGGDGPVH